MEYSKNSKKITPEKAEIIGLLCAEGSHYKYTATFFRDKTKKQKRTQVKEVIDFTNLDKRMLRYFRKLLAFVYNYEPKVTGVPTSLKIHICKKSVIKGLLTFTDFGYNKWRVPNRIMKSRREIKASFVRGLYEGDGFKLQRARKNCYYIGFNMKNKEGLNQLSILLSGLGIKSRFWSEQNGVVRLIIYGEEEVLKFKNIIKPKFKKINLRRTRGDNR